MERVLVTGATRGIGLEFARQYAEAGHHVIAGTRTGNATLALKQLAQRAKGPFDICHLDVTEEKTIDNLTDLIGDNPLDIVVNSAGIGGGTSSEGRAMDYEAWMEAFEVNTVGPYRVIDACRANLRQSRAPKAVTLSSLLGSIGNNRSGGRVIYRSTKAAANQVMRSLAEELNRVGIICVAIHPGWVRTDMGGPNATLTAEESVLEMRRLIDRLTLADSGRFLQWDGKEIDW